jgi:hypothetical protein
MNGSVRTGRSPVSLVVWALEWSLAMVLGVALVSALGFLIGWSGPTTILGFFTPFAVGAIVGWRTPGLGGFGIGFVGLAIGGAIVGIFAWVVSVLAGAFDPLIQRSPGENLAYIPLMTMLVPTLLGFQFGIGVLVATVLGQRQGARRS